MIFVLATSGRRQIHRSTYRLSAGTFATAACGEIKGRVATPTEILDDANALCAKCTKAARQKVTKVGAGR